MWPIHRHSAVYSASTSISVIFSENRSCPQSPSGLVSSFVDQDLYDLSWASSPLLRIVPGLVAVVEILRPPPLLFLELCLLSHWRQLFPRKFQFHSLRCRSTDFRPLHLPPWTRRPDLESWQKTHPNFVSQPQRQ
ncbi:hypothetical protein TB2_019812 [Malus domestica]